MTTGQNGAAEAKKPGPTSDKRKKGNAGPAKGAGNPNYKGGSSGSSGSGSGSSGKSGK